MSTREYTLRKIGSEFTRDFRIYLSVGDKPISPWHDIPLYSNERDKIFNIIIEVPRWENVKLEVCSTHLSEWKNIQRKKDTDW